MARGPLPKPNSRRRNKPAIEPAKLRPREEPAPDVPESYGLGLAGTAFWTWAWTLPQASKWDDGSRYFVARRAALEDDLLALDEADHLSAVLDEMIAEAVVEDDPMNFKTRLVQLTLTMRKLKSLAGGRVGVMKEMREIDNRLGLNPKALADLRWTIAESETKESKKESKDKGEVAKLDDYRDRLG